MFTSAVLGLLLFAAPDDWARWRGPFNNGMARSDAPTEWSDSKNIAWKAAIPGRGHSSPVLWGDKIFLTTAVPKAAPPAPPAAEGPGARRGPGGGSLAGVEHELLVLCLDRNTGKVLWQHSPKTVKPHEGYHFRYGSFASNSPVTDGKILITFFGSFGAYAYSLDGKPVWDQQFPPMRMRNAFGEGTAAVLDGERVILNFDQEGESFLAVFEKSTGKPIWKLPREERSSWAPPLVITHDGKKQIVVSATNKVRSYDYDSGAVIWECAGLGANVIPAPVTANGIVYVMSGYRDPNLLAIKLGRKGDLTGTDAILWTNQRGNSYTPSPVLFENRLYFVSDNGMLTAANATTGEILSQQRLPKPHNLKASPVGANGKLYISTEEGEVYVYKMGDKPEILATNTLTDQFFIASPAISEGKIYLRGQNTLFCIKSN
jgi:outer membrane protein assembly factor BamB